MGLSADKLVDNEMCIRDRSGTVNGFIKAQYFITGEAAEKLAQSIGREFVTVNADNLRLRSEPNLTSETLTLLSQGARYVVPVSYTHLWEAYQSG